MTANSVVNQIFQSESFVFQKGLNCPKLHDSRRWYRRPFPVPNPRFKALVQTAFPCTNSTIQCSWYTRKPFPVQTPRLKAVGTPESLFLYQIHDSMQLVHQKAFSCTNSTIQGVGTPDGLSLYQIHDSMHWYTRKPFPVPNPRFNALVHQKAFSCTNSNHQIE